MEFKRLRLSGFKSFVEPTELVIEQGLTGVVGPNGCGKSNLLEALRWVMGESSYKNMRGSGMDDVIFSGSGGRPSRNMAEVTVILDNSARNAPPAFNDAETIEISRRIEREAGSAYRINGKDVRARDVQLLFADASTGARSPALVRQGQIGELISAKPQARRKILEEAAGITGLHTRRHEAELRLRAAETNLTRVDDVVGQIETQLAGLKRQARQASRYKALSQTIRETEAVQLHLRWTEAAEALKGEQRALEEITRTLGDHTRASSEAIRAQEAAAAAMPGLRDEEVTAAAVLQRLTIERETLDAEEKRAGARKAELEHRGRQVAEDLAREQETIAETGDIVAMLHAEQVELEAASRSDGTLHAEAAETLGGQEGRLRECEAAFDQDSQGLAALRARRGAIEQAIADGKRRLERLEGQLAEVMRELDALGVSATAAADIAAKTEAVEAATAAQSDAEAATLAAEEALAAARATEQASRGELDGLDRDAQRLATEVATLSTLLAVADNDLWPPLIDAVKVEPGFETALGAALGDDLDVPADEAAPIHWDRLPDLETIAPLPGGAIALSTVVAAPPALARRLAHVGVVPADRGKALQAELKPGQRLVSQEGALWRWDGFTAAADAPTASALRLAQRNRLGELEIDSAAASAKANDARTAFDAAREAARQAAARETELRNDWRTANRTLSEARDALARAERAASEATARHSALTEAQTRLGGDIEEARRGLEAAQAELDGLDDATVMEALLQERREAVAEARAAYAEARARHEGITREIQARTDRLAAIERERATWAARVEKARSQIGTLDARGREIAQELEAMADLPRQWQERRSKLLSALSDAEARRSKAADALAEAEQTLAACDAQVRRTQDVLSEAREGRLGAVNLRAEEEATELAEQLDTLVTERDDLVKAIQRLRHGIAGLNKEGRERLLAAFETVNANFIRLFTHLFGGGSAELQLTESDDPAGGRPGDHGPPAGQEAAGDVAAVRRRAGADRAGADLRGVPDQPGADLRARRGGRAARRRQCRALLQPDGRDDPDHRHPLPGHHPQPAHHGADEPPVRRDHGRARRQPAGFGRSGDRRAVPRGGLSGRARARGSRTRRTCPAYWTMTTTRPARAYPQRRDDRRGWAIG
jgi:chromosome segregation protein